MNLGQIRERIQNELQHAPTTTAWKNDIAQVVNDVYQSLMSSERWTFRTVEGSLRLRADETGVTFKILGSGTSRAVSLRQDLVTPGLNVVRHHDFDATLLVASEGDNSLRRWGRIAGGKDWNPRWSQVRRQYDSRLGGWADPDLDAATSTLNIAGVDLVFLDATPSYPYVPISGSTTYTDGILRHDRYQMPFDCGEIIGIVSRDDKRGELELVNRTAERSLMLNTNQDAPGPPQAWVMDDPVDNGGPAPRKTLTSTNLTTTGTLAAGTYRYFYCWFGNGTMSGPSSILTVVTTGSTSRTTLTNMEIGPLDAASCRLQEWRKKLVFRDDGDGVFRYLAQVSAEVDTLADTGSLATLDETFRWDDRMAAPRKAIRFWPRPAQDQWVNVSYLKVPNRLVTAQDTPEMPEEYHRILVHLAVAQLAARFDQVRLVQMHTAQAREIRAMMVNKEIARYDTSVRQAWGPRQSRRWMPTNPASMT